MGTQAQFLQQMFCNQNIQIKKEGKGTYQLKATEETHELNARCARFLDPNSNN